MAFVSSRSKLFVRCLRGGARLFALCAMLPACGASRFTRTRTEWQAMAAARQTQGALTAENVDLKEIPPSMFATVQACNAQNQLLVDQQGNQITEKVPLIPVGGMLYQVRLTNQTGHVVRLTSAVVRMFDPAGNPVEPVSKNDIGGLLMLQRPCPSTAQMTALLTTQKFIDSNTELLPNVTTTGWLYFKPQSLEIPGTWKLAIYDVVVETDAAGNPTKKVTFEWPAVQKKFRDTYTQEFMKEPVLAGTETIE